MNLCQLCDSNKNVDYAIICPLLNDPILKVCLECINEQKIKNNETQFKDSIWNKA